MRVRTLLATAALLATFAPSAAVAASATFVDRDGEPIGTAELTQLPSGVLVEVDVRGLPAGEHAFHLHATGTCTPPDFESAGGHYADGKAHGFAHADGPHPGDFPNQFVGADGRLRAHLFNARLTLDGDRAPVFDADGSAFVIHAGADDYVSQPAGAAGPRIACAVVDAD